MKYIVIARTWGDGEAFAGRRIWSQEFKSRRAAEEALAFLKGKECEVILIRDDGSDMSVGEAA